MANMKISARDRFLLVFLALLLIGVSYYLFFYQPLQNDLASIAAQTEQVEQDMTIAAAKVGKMKKMQDELDEIFSSVASESEVTEIAPYDNAKVVMSQLNGILSASDNYSLVFRDPEIEKDSGFVRRQVNMVFECVNYASAKRIVKELSSSHWRCLINGISLKPTNNLKNTVAEDPTEELPEIDTPDNILIFDVPVTISATITFFESTQLAN